MQEMLQRSGRLPWREAVDLGVKLAGALQIAHQAAVLHGDVKPANVLLDDDGEPQLADFGIARLTDATRLTAGQASFTPAHVAPEVLTGSAPTPLVDVRFRGAGIARSGGSRRPFEPPARSNRRPGCPLTTAR
ncbi:MAG: protein kinase domain-containing protein [Acidimicrobiales bacterium]